MDLSQDTPSKRRKLEDGTAHKSQGYDSENDSGDDIFDQYETVATLPIPQKPPLNVLSSPKTYITQPTQVVRQGTPEEDEGGYKEQSQVQVPASSPVPAPERAPVTATNGLPGGLLASSMAPAGTAFRLPYGVARAPPTIVKKPVIDLSDDDLPTYNGSSEEDSQASRKADIKPSAFVAGDDRFGAKVSRFAYKPNDNTERTNTIPTGLSGSVFDSRNRDEKQTKSQFAASKRSADVMPKQPRQTGPSKALPANDLDINEIPDYQTRDKIKRMQVVLPSHSVLACQRALEVKRNNYDDAIDYLMSKEENSTTVDLTVSDGEDPLSSKASTQKAPAKQQVKVKQNIQEKWTATQNFTRNLPPSSPLTGVSSPVPPKPKRRLVRGRKQSLSPVPISTPPKELSSVRPPTPSIHLDQDETDSGIGSEPDDSELETKVLRFFNTCSVPDLSDIATITVDVASLILSKKPFHSLEDVRRITNDAPIKALIAKSMRKPIGDKILNKCLDMWTGYEAIDELVKQCEEISKPLKEDMRAWGFDIFGAATNGEIELASFSRDMSPRDSGIGTPTSVNVSDIDGDVEVISRRPKVGLFPQPSIMAEGIQLKDYQVIGVNWLSLLFERNLSCILADDMGLGKTCQVIAFIAHLLEKGKKGPHLVIVPSSTLENWLREFSIFCPKLNVMPYYAGQSERPYIQEQIMSSLETLNVVVTTYPMTKARDDNKFLRKLKPVICVYDEGHVLKNSKSAGYEALMRIPSQFRLLLTGTPLQNNLMELASLLGFILPSVFRDHSQDLEAIFSHKAKTSNESHAALLSDQRIARAKSMMTPFVLRRKKHQVLKHLPVKTRKVEYCELSPSQTVQYEKEKAKAQRIITARAAGEKIGSESANIMMALRKASIHPLLFRHLYSDDVLLKMAKGCLKEEEFRDRDRDLVFEDMSIMTDMELSRFW